MKHNYLKLAASTALVSLFCGGSLAWAQVGAGTPANILPNLQRFSAFGSGGVVGSAGAGTAVNGDVGGFATCTVTNFAPSGPSTVVPPFVLHGPTCDGVVAAADLEATTAFNSLSQAGALAINPSLNLVDLPGAPPVGVLVPGNYSTGAAILPSNTTLTFDGAGIYVIQVASSLDVVTGPLTNMVLINGARACDVYWQVGSSANLQVQGANQVVGQVFATAAVTVTAGNLTGRAIALNAAMTMSNGGNIIGGCATAAPVCPAIAIAPLTTPTGTVGVAYNQTFTGSGGLAPYTFALNGGSLPGGLTLTGGGGLSGTPTAAGTFNFTIRATDANGCFGDRAYSIAIAPAGCPVISLSPASLPNAPLGVAYSQTVSASGGLAPYAMSLSSGSLPAGLTLSGSGLISGNPTGSGTSAFTVRATDANGCLADRPYTITVAPAVPTLPEVFLLLLAILLGGIGYMRLRGAPKAE